MRIINKDEFNTEKNKILREIANGAVFIHPTDTIYGIGCNAADGKCVKKVREAKKQFDRPLSVIAPSKDWIRKNCVVDEEAEEWLAKLPGPYTIILKLKNKDIVAPETHLNTNTLGVRIPNHWISSIAQELNLPIITTSANLTGKLFMTKIEDLHPEVKKKTDFAIYEGEKHGKPSTIVDLTTRKIIDRQAIFPKKTK